MRLQGKRNIEQTKDTVLTRILFLLFGFSLFVILLIGRLFQWQIINADELATVAKNQRSASKTLLAERGSILTSDGFPLVSSKENWLLWASPKRIENTTQIASDLANVLVDEIEQPESTESAKPREELFKEEKERVLGILNKKDAVWVPIKRKLSRDTKQRIEALGVKGIGFDPQEDRSYPEGSMSGQLIGFVGKDEAGQNKGYFGLEGYYDLSLSGIEGKKAWEKDATGRPILLGNAREVGALDGASLQTHINRSVQFIAEKHLEEGLKRYGASQGMVVVMRPQDGAILALASLPSYEPLKFNSYDPSLYINPVVSGSYEPGSIFKIVVMASALDAGVVTPEMRCDSCSGPRKIAEYTIGTWNDQYYPDSTPGEIIQHSDNTGMIWAAEKLGIDKFYSYIQKFGFGEPTGIDLQGEADPKLRDKRDWRFIDLATTSFGQGVAITPIQMVRATSVIANGGKLPAPQVVDKIIGPDWEKDISPRFKENVISEKTAKEITEMMVQAVEQGEAKWAKPKGFKVAGKTGTAQIPIAGHYDPEKTIASFIGFAPADNPQFVMLVSLREPQSSPWGSETAAPLWFAISKDIFPYLGIKPDTGY